MAALAKRTCLIRPLAASLGGFGFLTPGSEAASPTTQRSDLGNCHLVDKSFALDARAWIPAYPDAGERVAQAQRPRAVFEESPEHDSVASPVHPAGKNRVFPAYRAVLRASSQLQILHHCTKLRRARSPNPVPIRSDASVEEKTALPRATVSSLLSRIPRHLLALHKSPRAERLDLAHGADVAGVYAPRCPYRWLSVACVLYPSSLQGRSLRARPHPGLVELICGVLAGPARVCNTVTGPFARKRKGSRGSARSAARRVLSLLNSPPSRTFPARYGRVARDLGVDVTRPRRILSTRLSLPTRAPTHDLPAPTCPRSTRSSGDAAVAITIHYAPQTRACPRSSSSSTAQNRQRRTCARTLWGVETLVLNTVTAGRALRAASSRNPNIPPGRALPAAATVARSFCLSCACTHTPDFPRAQPELTPLRAQQLASSIGIRHDLRRLVELIRFGTHAC
ncbi:hypothetical protein C8R47DRAFT_1228789 [Mycena vitilis]|nr:hypothetical protein C8R47DRAFT_1228789 [Mycena vitilis]